MSFEICEISESDFSEVIRSMWNAFENPPQQLFRLFAPLNSTGEVNREAAVEESTARYWSWHVSDPASHWQKVVDSSDGSLVGAALWKIYTKNPFEEPAPHLSAYWHPEGGQREFATQALSQHEAVRQRCAQRPHLYLAIMFVIPKYQKNGVGETILAWGVDRAVELQLEMWADVWRFGRNLFTKFGFTVVDKHILKPVHENPDDVWIACEKEWIDLEEWAMWRPKGSPYIEGQSVKPWEDEYRIRRAIVADGPLSWGLAHIQC